MTIRELIAATTRELEPLSKTPALDAIILVSLAADLSKEQVLASYPDEASPDLAESVRSFTDRRLTGEPVAYIAGKKEFFGREFIVDRRVLIPRPDTEILIEAVLDTSPHRRILDIGTGSGCIAITLAAELDSVEVTAADCSAEALEVCRINASRLLEKPISIVQSDLFEHVDGKFDCIVSNPPYLTVEERSRIYGDEWLEPNSALESGADGLDTIRRLIKTSVDYLDSNGYLFIEASPGQMTEIRALLSSVGYGDIAVYPDLSGDARIIGARNGSSAFTTRS